MPLVLYSQNQHQMHFQLHLKVKIHWCLEIALAMEAVCFCPEDKEVLCFTTHGFHLAANFKFPKYINNLDDYQDERIIYI